MAEYVRWAALGLAWALLIFRTVPSDWTAKEVIYILLAVAIALRP